MNNEDKKVRIELAYHYATTVADILNQEDDINVWQMSYLKEYAVQVKEYLRPLAERGNLNSVKQS